MAYDAVASVRRRRMEVLATYLPQDRCRALARQAALPDHASGAALFADISGFTPLAERLAQTLGPRRGAEELTVHLNAVYDALIREVEVWGGSVIAFAGDAITCWFDADAGTRATAAALAMQTVMARFATIRVANGSEISLAVKTSVVAGPARRFVVGDPGIRLLDVLAGQTLAHLAAAAAATRRGEVILDEPTVVALADQVLVREWRTGAGSGARFGLIDRLARTMSVEAPEPCSPPAAELTRPWLIPDVHTRLRAGLGEFLTELRPAVALFLKFEGLDYDHDEAAGDKLNAFVCWIQRLLQPYEGFLLDLNVGDKGSYLYCAFGAPIAHEDDTRRALSVAAKLRGAPTEFAFLRAVQIGISRGTMRTGAYGGSTRRTYGVLGDEVNLAARLMEKAAPGEVLVSGRIHADCEDDFSWRPLPALQVKGKSVPVPVFALGEAAPRRSAPKAGLGRASPMVGRTVERRLIEARVKLAVTGHGQIVGFTGEAGMGKSRLLAEAVSQAQEQGMTVFSGECQSFGANTSYLVWWDIWRKFFQIDSQEALPRQLASLEAALSGYSPELLPRLPLLGAALNLALPENDLTRHFDSKLRKASLEALLVECVQRRAARRPLVFVLEDAHWLDPLSRDLLETLARAVPALPVLILIAYRPPEPTAPPALGFLGWPHFTEVALVELPRREAEELFRLRLAELFGPEALPTPMLVDRLVTRSDGNPFYLEELLHYLQDRGVDPSRTDSPEELDLPNSLHSLILSRIDRLLESERVTLKVASILGRLFPAAALWSINANLSEPQVRADLVALSRIELMIEDQPEPALVYLFKHVVTQEVAYESLAFGTRAALHNEIGLYLEAQGAAAAAQHLDLLAHHFDRAENAPKRRHYLLRAGEAAQARYANAAAISYFQRCLPLLDPAEQIPVRLKLGRVLELVGNWDEAAKQYRAAEALAAERSDVRNQAAAQATLGELHRKRGHYAEALACLDAARSLYRQVADEAGIAETLHYAGSVAGQQGNYEAASDLYRRSLDIRRRLHDQPRIASLFSNLGIIAWYSGDFAEARVYYEAALSLRREIGDRWAIANSLNNLGLVLRDLGDVREARALLEQALAISREIGDRWSVANTLSSLGDVALTQDDLAAARAFLVESLTISRELNDRTGQAFLLEYFGVLAAKQRQPGRAFRVVGAAAALRETIGAPLSPSEQARLDRTIEAACPECSVAQRREFIAEGRRLALEDVIGLAVGSPGPASP